MRLFYKFYIILQSLLDACDSKIQDAILSCYKEKTFFPSK